MLYNPANIMGNVKIIGLDIIKGPNNKPAMKVTVNETNKLSSDTLMDNRYIKKIVSM
jgi:hypothetical protein